LSGVNFLTYTTAEKAQHGGKRKIPPVFYRTSSGAKPVRDWLKALDPEDRKAVGMNLMRAQLIMECIHKLDTDSNLAVLLVE